MRTLFLRLLNKTLLPCRNFYEVLKVSEYARTNQIEEAYRQLMAQPAVTSDPQIRARIEEAYSVLKDVEKRARYDSALMKQEPERGRVDNTKWIFDTVGGKLMCVVVGNCDCYICSLPFQTTLRPERRADEKRGKSEKKVRRQSGSNGCYRIRSVRISDNSARMDCLVSSLYALHSFENAFAARVGGEKSSISL